MTTVLFVLLSFGCGYVFGHIKGSMYGYMKCKEKMYLLKNEDSGGSDDKLNIWGKARPCNDLADLKMEGFYIEEEDLS